MGSWDCDDVCSWKTQRFVRIRDRRLGILYNVLLFGIAMYVRCWPVCFAGIFRDRTCMIARLLPSWEGTYMSHAVTTLLLPPAGGVRSVVPTRRYCGAGTYEVELRDGDGHFDEDQLECRFYDEGDAVYPYVENGATYLSSRIEERIELVDPSCSRLERLDCLPYNVTDRTNYFVADPDIFTVKLDHALYVPGRDTSTGNEQMTGKLLQHDGNEVDECRVYKEMSPDDWERLCREESNVVLGKKGDPDILPMAALMDAAGLFTLYRESMENRAEGRLRSLRYAGFILVVTIDYSNWLQRTGSFSEDAFDYKVTVEVIDGLQYKGEQIVETIQSEDRLRRVINRHGLRVIVTQSGLVGFFDFQQLLIQMVTSMGLLAVANAIVNFIAMHLMELKHIYSKYETVTSVDFSDLGHLPEPTLRRFKTEDLINPRPAIFAEVESKDAGGMTANARRGPRVTAQETAASQGGFFGSFGVGDSPYSPVDPADAEVLDITEDRQPSGNAGSQRGKYGAIDHSH